MQNGNQQVGQLQTCVAKAENLEEEIPSCLVLKKRRNSSLKLVLESCNLKKVQLCQVVQLRKQLSGKLVLDTWKSKNHEIKITT